MVDLYTGLIFLHLGLKVVLYVGLVVVLCVAISINPVCRTGSPVCRTGSTVCSTGGSPVCMTCNSHI